MFFYIIIFKHIMFKIGNYAFERCTLLLRICQADSNIWYNAVKNKRLHFLKRAWNLNSFRHPQHALQNHRTPCCTHWKYLDRMDLSNPAQSNFANKLHIYRRWHFNEIRSMSVSFCFCFLVSFHLWKYLIDVNAFHLLSVFSKHEWKKKHK